MIYVERTIKIKKDQAQIEEPIVLYKGDKNIEIQFTIENNPFKYKAGMDVTYGQLVITRPSATPIFSELAKLSSSKVLFTVTDEMIDELVELGDYDFQIRLVSANKAARATLPPITAGIVIREPICEEAAVNTTYINNKRAVIMRATNESDNLFDAEGNYNKINWTSGDIITDAKLNRVEEALYQINNNSVPADYASKEYVNTAIESIELTPGPQGEMGPQGPQGEPGKDADLTGYATEEYVYNYTDQAMIMIEEILCEGEVNSLINNILGEAK